MFKSSQRVGTTSGPVVTIHVDPSNELQVEKRFDPAAASECGTREAIWLAQAAHPGVVRLLTRHDTLDLNVLAYVPGPTLRTSGLAPGAAAGVLASAARTLADLHDAGHLHGAVHPDHVLIPDRPSIHQGRPVLAILCSPSPAADPSVDSHGLGLCAQWLLEEWRNADVTVPGGWQEVAERLLQEHPLTARRAATYFARLADPHLGPKSIKQARRSARPSARVLRSIVGTAAGLAAAIVFLSSCQTSDATSTQGRLRLAANGSVFALGGPDDAVIALPHRCDGQPAALLLRRETSQVWTFDQVEDGAKAEAMAVVPGATELRMQPGTPCPRVWATGPGGEVELDWP